MTFLGVSVDTKYKNLRKVMRVVRILRNAPFDGNFESKERKRKQNQVLFLVILAPLKKIIARIYNF